jgi:predicted RNA-binding Zn-ribbon protein involved in translation (DUF1610 family)
MRKRTSVVWSISKDEFSDLVKRSTSYREILKYFSLEHKGGNGKTLKRRIEEDNVDDSHIKNRPKTMNAHISNTISSCEILVKDSCHSRSMAKRRIIKDSLFDHTLCSECGKENIWREKPLIMVLDHINGISNDHRIENLRFLCPDCNSQMPTFAGRSNKVKHFCQKCGEEKKTKGSEVCSKCEKESRRKVERPPLYVLQSEIDNMGYSAVGRKYGVSGNSIRKWLK